MTFPAGRLPQNDDVTMARSVGAPYMSLAFSGGGSDVDLTALPIGYCTRVYCTTAGTFIAQLSGDVGQGAGTYQTYTLSQDDFLPGIFVLVKGTSTCNAILLKS